MTEPTTVARPPSPWARAHLGTTVGIFALAFLFAFEALAVSTVMPDVAADLDGLALYAVAFAAPLAAAVVGYPLAGSAIDSRGPGPVLTLGVVVFGAGVLLAGVAPTMWVFLAGRLVHGFGGGLFSVAIYVLVAQCYPESLRPRVFSILAAAWVVPALVGPVLAATVAEAVGWRWVFLGVPVLAAGAWALVPKNTSPEEGRERGRPPLALALLAAAGVLGISLAGQRDLAIWPALLAVAGLLVLVAGPRLLPPGSWTARRGLPSVIGTRGLISAAFAVAEAHIPLLLVLERKLSLAEAGWVLTVGAVAWSIGSWAAARVPFLDDQQMRVRLGVLLMVVGIAGFQTAAVATVPIVVPVLAWAVTGLGIGMAFPTLSVLALAGAPSGEEGAVSSALQINDALVQAVALAVASAVFAGFAASAPAAGALVLLAAAAVIAVAALGPATRLAGRS